MNKDELMVELKDVKKKLASGIRGSEYKVTMRLKYAIESHLKTIEGSKQTRIKIDNTKHLVDELRTENEQLRNRISEFEGIRQGYAQLKDKLDGVNSRIRKQKEQLKARDLDIAELSRDNRELKQSIDSWQKNYDRLDRDWSYRFNNLADRKTPAITKVSNSLTGLGLIGLKVVLFFGALVILAVLTKGIADRLIPLLPEVVNNIK